MSRKAVIELIGSASYTAPGKPSFRRGVPVVTVNEDIISWALTVGFLKVTVTEVDEPELPKPELKPEPPKLEPVKKPVKRSPGRPRKKTTAKTSARKK